MTPEMVCAKLAEFNADVLKEFIRGLGEDWSLDNIVERAQELLNAYGQEMVRAAIELLSDQLYEDKETRKDPGLRA